MTEKIKREVQIVAIPQLPVQYLIWNEEHTEIAGYCMITGIVKSKILTGNEYKEAAIWHIYVDPKYRKKHYGACLIEAIKANYDEIYTQSLTAESEGLLVKAGFVHKISHEGIKTYRWIKVSN